MRIFLSGPMTGKPDLNRSAFDAAEGRKKLGKPTTISGDKAQE